MECRLGWVADRLPQPPTGALPAPKTKAVILAALHGMLSHAVPALQGLGITKPQTPVDPDSDTGNPALEPPVPGGNGGGTKKQPRRRVTPGGAVKPLCSHGATVSFAFSLKAFSLQPNEI